jgi:peptidoglycan/LPS O-acetylase OafA/YrhL
MAGGANVVQAGEVRSARIESLRALAALGVLSAHVYGTAHSFGPVVYTGYLHRAVMGGGFGVWLFFVLTGYLLFWPYAKEGFRGGRVNLRAYARNRALRIVPLYLVVLLVLFPLQEGGGSAAQWLRFLTFSENFSHSSLRTVDGVLWSLVIEVHFYVVLPLLAALVLRLSRGSLRRAAAAVLALGLASLALRLRMHDALWQNSLPATFFFFAAGMLLALLRLRLEQRAVPRLPAAGDAWVAGALVLWALVVYHYPWDPLCALAGMLLLGACVLPLRPGLTVRILEWRPLAAVGVASYSLYVWHFPIVSHLEKSGHVLGWYALLVPLCLAVALVSYRVIEAPFLRLRGRWATAGPEQQEDALDVASGPLPAMDSTG